MELLESQKLIFSGFPVLKGLMNCDDRSMKIIPEFDTVLLNSVILDNFNCHLTRSVKYDRSNKIYKY